MHGYPQSFRIGMHVINFKILTWDSFLIQMWSGLLAWMMPLQLFAPSTDFNAKCLNVLRDLNQIRTTYIIA